MHNGLKTDIKRTRLFCLVVVVAEFDQIYESPQVLIEVYVGRALRFKGDFENTVELVHGNLNFLQRKESGTKSRERKLKISIMGKTITLQYLWRIGYRIGVYSYTLI